MSTNEQVEIDKALVSELIQPKSTTSTTSLDTTLQPAVGETTLADQVTGASTDTPPSTTEISAAEVERQIETVETAIVAQKIDDVPAQPPAPQPPLPPPPSAAKSTTRKRNNPSTAKKPPVKRTRQPARQKNDASKAEEEEALIGKLVDRLRQENVFSDVRQAVQSLHERFDREFQSNADYVVQRPNQPQVVKSRRSQQAKKFGGEPTSEFTYF
jgi:hypothetical protein